MSEPTHRAGGAALPPVEAELFRDGGEMGALMRATDWAKTGLGPVEQWPQSLRTMLGVVLGSRFPMLLWWGPDLLHLYNDAYRPILRDKHPASLAAPAAEVWAEVWDVAGPMARSVQAGGPATWTEDLQLFIKHGEMAEETYFTFSYSPVPGDDGRIGGLLNTVQETTAKVQSEREIRMLHDLAARAAECRSESDAYTVALDVLASNELDLPFAMLYALEDPPGVARLTASSAWPGYTGPAKPARVVLTEPAGSAAWPFDEVMRSGREVFVNDLAARFGPLPMGRWSARPQGAVAVPLTRAGQAAPFAILVLGVSPHRALDERYRRFFRATADQVANVVASARAYEVEAKRALALAEIDRAKTAFFSNVSHEFRTPLTLILGPIEDALSQPEGSLGGASLAGVHRSALRLLRLVNSLLDFARIEAGRQQLSFSPTDLSSLTAELASSFRSLIERAGLVLKVDCPPLPEPIYVDPTQWEKIVLNLLSNAFKFTFEGSISVRLQLSAGQVELSVEDTGTGIPAPELAHLFERFRRVEGAKGRSFEGTGIGLSLVRELARLHGGSVSVTSQEGRGTTFRVSLPTGNAHLPADCILERAAQAPPGAAPYLLEASQWLGLASAAQHDSLASASAFAGSSAPAPAPEGSAGRSHFRVLVVDDNRDMREYLSRLLSPHWQVQLAEDGRVALELAHERPPDLVLSDVMMPRLDGVGLLRELRDRPRTSHIPVVLLSARAGEEAMLEGLATGADDYVTKPFAARELLARVRTHLELARLRREWSSELERANSELEAFSYSVSHDLRAPLRAIDGFSAVLLDEYSDKLDAEGRHYLERVRTGAQRMGRLIEDLLSLSQITRAPLRRQSVDLSAEALAILSELRARDPGRSIELRIQDNLEVEADAGLLRVMLENLLNNAWKFTSRKPLATIELGGERREESMVFWVRDNGAGFDARHAKRLFAPFQRLHTQAEFAGTGVGLATVKRVAARHGGRIWAEASPGHGATFFFTLGG